MNGSCTVCHKLSVTDERMSTVYWSAIKVKPDHSNIEEIS